MRRTLSFLFVLALAAGAFAGSHNHGHCGTCISMDDMEGDTKDCSRLRVTIDDQPAVRAEESVPVGSLRSLIVHAPENGGVHVVGSDGPSYEVKACKAAALDEDLRDIHVRLNGNELTADGPGRGRWVVYFLVRAPRNATLDLRSQNGPIALRNVNGSVTARAINGPISSKGSSGSIDLDTTNGPISLDGGSGSTKLRAQNGPITVKLRGTSWDGSLDAHTENGPLAVHVPSGFRTGVLVESDGHGPVSCHAEACRDARKTWDDDNRRIEIGSGPTAVHLSTVNGPVAVHDE